MLILALQFYEGDKYQATSLARLIADLEPAKRSDVTFLFSARFDTTHDEDTVKYVAKKFNVVKFTSPQGRSGWPAGPNDLFRETYQFCIEAIRKHRINAEAILFMEADCVPLAPDWIDQLIKEYRGCGKMVLGCWLTRGDCNTVHINGNCIIHKDFWRTNKGILEPASGGWDAVNAKDMMANGAASRLIWSDYGLGKPGYNEWKGCDHLWGAKRFKDPNNPLYGEELHPVWYHGPKDMRGIECVREKMGSWGIQSPVASKPEKVVPESRIARNQAVTDIFVVTYRRDAQWLEYLLRSIQKHARGFRQTIVVYPTRDKSIFDAMCSRFPNTKGVSFNEAKDGHMHHNIIKCTADTFSDADYFLHIDSDCVFLERTAPSDYMTNGKPDLLFTPYSNVPSAPWRAVTEAAIGIRCDCETMRRHPFLYPRELYGITRGRVEAIHHMPFDEYVFSAPKIGGAHRGFSEFNALGSVGKLICPEMFNLVDTERGVRPSHVRQYWSFSNITDQERFELEWVTKDYQNPQEDREAWIERNEKTSITLS